MVTILYYTSNRENESFENKIRENLLRVCGDLPIISVSQKPIDLGTNICVDDVGTSGFNMFRQVLIGCKAATTEFIISAEADCLYPPEYFKFIPSRNDVCYREKNLYVLRRHREVFHKKRNGATHAQIIGREFYIKRLEELFGDAPEWNTQEKNFPKERCKKEDIVDQVEYYETIYPTVQIKTGESMRHYTACIEREAFVELPYWGTVENMRKNYL